MSIEDAKKLLSEISNQKKDLIDKISRSEDPETIHTLESELFELNRFIKSLQGDSSDEDAKSQADQVLVNLVDFESDSEEDGKLSIKSDNITGKLKDVSGENVSSDREYRVNDHGFGPSSSQSPAYSGRMSNMSSFKKMSVEDSKSQPQAEKAKEKCLIEVDDSEEDYDKMIKQEQIERDRQLALEISKQWENAQVIEDSENDERAQLEQSDYEYARMLQKEEDDHANRDDYAQMIQRQEDEIYENNKKQEESYIASSTCKNSSRCSEEVSHSALQLNEDKTHISEDEVQIFDGKQYRNIDFSFMNQGLNQPPVVTENLNPRLSQWTDGLGYDEPKQLGFMNRIKLGLSSLLRFYKNADDFGRDYRRMRRNYRNRTFDRRIIPIISRAFRALSARDNIMSRNSSRYTSKQSTVGYKNNNLSQSQDMKANLNVQQKTLEVPDQDPFDNNIEQDIKKLLDNITQKEIVKPENREGTPEGLIPTLMEHQKEGLMWLKKMEDGEIKGGLLADDMGLGKTITMLALLVARPYESSNKSDDKQAIDLPKNVNDDSSKKLEDEKLSKSSDFDKKSNEELQNADKFPKKADKDCLKQSLEESSIADVSFGGTITKPLKQIVEKKANLVICPVALLQQWRREIQSKTNVNGKPLSVHIHHGQTKNLVGKSKFGLFDVILTTYNIVAMEYKEIAAFEKAIMDKSSKQGPSNEKVDLLRRPYCPIMDTEWYRIILDESQNVKNRNTLAAKGIIMLKSRFKFCLTGTPIQNGVDELFTTIQFIGIKPYNSWNQFAKDFVNPLKLKGGTSEIAMKRLQALLSTIMLRRTKQTIIDGKQIIDLVPKDIKCQEIILKEDEREFYNNLEKQAQSAMNRYIEQNSVGNNYGNLLVLLLRLRQAVCHPMLVKKEKEQKPLSEENDEQAKKLAEELLPETVARIKEETSFECGICLDPVFNPVFAVPCGHYVCEECLIRLAQRSTERDPNSQGISCPLCRANIKYGNFITERIFVKVHGDIPVLKNYKELELLTDVDNQPSIDSQREGVENSAKRLKQEEPNVEKVEQELKRDYDKKQPELKIDKGKRKKVEIKYKVSSKIDALIRLLEEIQIIRPGEKVIVFSQFREFLNIIANVLDNYESIVYERYDGSLSPKQRDDAIYRFNEDPELLVFLVSLKAGNVGLNLMAANHIVMMDPYWNPAVEDQAVDRAHRIGQKLPVFVYKFLVKDSVEERVITLQDKKRALIQGALEEKASEEIARLSQQELRYLFGV